MRSLVGWLRVLQNYARTPILYQTLVEQVQDYAILFLGTGGEIKTWNLGAERILGYTTDEILGKNFRCLHTQQDQQDGTPERLLAAAVDTGYAEEEALRVRKDGSTFWAVITITALRNRRGRLIGFSKVTRDITERKRAQEIEDLLDAAPDAIVIIDGEGEIVRVNVQTEKLFGYRREELLGQKIEILVPERFHAGHRQQRVGYFKQPHAREMGSGMELYARRKDNSEFPVEISLSPLNTERGLFVSSAIRDVTERKAEEDLRRIGHELKVRNTELEQFAYLASHDLQEPLRTIANFAQVLETDYRDRLDADGKQALTFILRAVERMSRLIKDLLDHSRLGLGSELEVIDCNRLLEAVLENLSTAINQQQASVHVAPLPTIRGQRTELQLLFQNLISNAIKFRNPDKFPEISVTAIKMRDAWQFAVTDKGIGIKPAYREKIFQLFQRLHAQSQYDGSGIGLAHCKKIVRLHGGEIWVDSSPGEGSTFYFTLRETKQ